MAASWLLPAVYTDDVLNTRVDHMNSVWSRIIEHCNGTCTHNEGPACTFKISSTHLRAIRFSTTINTLRIFWWNFLIRRSSNHFYKPCLLIPFSWTSLYFSSATNINKHNLDSLVYVYLSPWIILYTKANCINLLKLEVLSNKLNKFFFNEFSMD